MITAILQARMSSTRLPGKVLKPIMDRPMIDRQLERLQRSTKLDELVVATSTRVEDDDIAELCDKIQVKCFRGKLSDVLDRFYCCAQRYHASHIVRLTADCPLADPEIIDKLVTFYLENDFDYASNCRPPTLPDGLDAEIFSLETLERAWKNATASFDREHVVPYIIGNSDQFNIGNWSYEHDLSGMRWTVDEPDDLKFIEKVYEALYPRNPKFGLEDVIDFLHQNPEIVKINSRFKRNQGSKRN